MVARGGLVAALFLVLMVGCQRTTVEGPGGKKLTLTKPSDQTLKRGDMHQVKVSISRTGFTDEVGVQLENLPAGVVVENKDHKIGSNESSATFNVKAEDNAGLVANQEVRVTVTGPDGMKVMEPFKITIKEK